MWTKSYLYRFLFCGITEHLNDSATRVMAIYVTNSKIL